MAAFLLATFLAQQATPQPSPLPEGNAFVRGLLEAQRRREQALDDYTYDILEVREELDAGSTVKQRRTRLVQVFYVKGSPVRRTVEEDGRPLPPQRQRQEDERARRDARALSRGEVLTKRTRLSLVLERFDFRSVAREQVLGRPAIVLEFAPLPGKREQPDDKLLRSLAGKLWVDEAERQIVRAELRATNAIKVALGLGARVSELRLAMEFHKVDGLVWLPLRVETEAAGRAFLFKRFRSRLTASYGNYRRFRVDSQETLRPEP